jgi:hypothetical protein
MDGTEHLPNRATGPSDNGVAWRCAIRRGQLPLFTPGGRHAHRSPRLSSLASQPEWLGKLTEEILEPDLPTPRLGELNLAGFDLSLTGFGDL